MSSVYLNLNSQCQKLSVSSFFSSCRCQLTIFPERRPFLGDHELPPNLPHLVVVPGTLLAQWVTELKTFFRMRVVDILVYPTKRADHAKFWAPDGPYESSIHDPSRRIIVASHSVRHSPLLHSIWIYFWPVSSSRLLRLIQFWERGKTTVGLAPPSKRGKVAGHSLRKGVPYVHSRRKSPTEECWHEALFCAENCGTQCADSRTYCNTCADQDRRKCIGSTIYLLF